MTISTYEDFGLNSEKEKIQNPYILIHLHTAVIIHLSQFIILNRGWNNQLMVCLK